MASKHSSQFPSDSTEYLYCTLITPNYAEPEDSPASAHSSSPQSGPTLMIHILARFTLSEDPENPEYHAVTYSHAFPLSPAALSNDVEAGQAIAWVLSDMRIAASNGMVEQILELGRNMMNQSAPGQDLVCLHVEIDAVVDELPLPPEDDCQDPYSVEELRLRSMATTKRLIGDSQSESCSVCFEDFVIGYEATRLPCSHLFHESCIQKWFQKSKSCPLCRFEMPC